MIPLLLLEDETRVAAFLKRGLEAEGYRVTLVGTGNDAITYGQEGEYELIILDVMVPGPDGMQVCASLRGAGIDTPILMLTARDDNEDIIDGLGSGADDYLAKPFAFDVLLARLEALHRRRNVPLTRTSHATLTAGALTLDLDAREVSVGETAVELTRTEFDVLTALARKPGSVISRERILSSAWGADKDPMTNVVDVYVARLRRKLPGVRIEAVRGAGYKLAAER